MISDYPIIRISDGKTPAIHSYYDLCPEQPDGDRVLLSVWDNDTIPGPARVGIGDVDGGPVELIDQAAQTIGHTGRYPMWIDHDQIAYHLGIEYDAAGWCAYHLSSGQRTEHQGGLRQFDIHRKQGLVLINGELENPHGYRQIVSIIDKDGTEVNRLTVSDARNAHADPSSLPPCTELNFMNAKWSHDGSCFFVVFTDELYLRDKRDLRPKFKCLIVADADGGNVRFLQNFSHHPHWSPDNRFAFAMMVLERDGRTTQDVCAFDRETGEQRTLLRNVPGIHPTILPDGQSLVIDEFNSPENGQAQIVRWNLKTSEKEVLVRFNHRKYDHTFGHHPHPSLSRDGTRIYFNAQDTGPCQVYALDL